LCLLISPPIWHCTARAASASARIEPAARHSVAGAAPGAGEDRGGRGTGGHLSDIVSCRNLKGPDLNPLATRLRALAPEVLGALLRGIEKEGLRVRPDGMLTDTPHPRALGSALTHPSITTDFSESQVELITGVHARVDDCLAELTELHQVVYRQIGDELLWCASMPCTLPAEDEIPLGQYGTANVGRLKTAYRQGLAHRYGRRMQTISGIHYNFSLPEEAWPRLQNADRDTGPTHAYQDRGYLSLIRNFRRHSWLLLILFGASPAVCGSFLGGHPHALTAWDTGTLIAPYGTSLRMGRLGYQSDAQASLAVSFNSLGGYAAALHRSLTEPYPPYEAIGLTDGTNYRQLATTLLQIENEFYGTIRPKRRIHPGERPLRALGERGVEYVEVRCIDVNPFHPIGIDAAEIRFIDIFLLHCLLQESPDDTPQEIAAISRNQHLAAERGRDPDLRLDRDGQPVAPGEWGAVLLRECEPIAAALDDAHGGQAYRTVLFTATDALRNAATLPSARVLREAERDYGRSFPRLALDYSQRHRRTLLELPLAEAVAARYARMADESLARQREIEAADTVPFEIHRQRYLGQDLLGGAHFRPES
jgi:glutamate--cysteine ligase